MKRILIVDDEPHILAGLRTLLRRYRRKWELVFADGGEAAWKELERQPCDVIVSDLRMPGMDGATLLKRVQAQHPGTVRIILSGSTELETARRAIPFAHQFLAKPCNAEVLENVIDRAYALQALLEHERLQEVIGSLSTLPTVPKVYAALVSALADEKTTAKAVARILEQDMAICAKLLQLVNSAFLRTARRITSIPEAVVFLGLSMVKNLVLSVEVFQAPRNFPTFDGFSLEAMQRHALHTARIATHIAPDKYQAEDAFMAGILHDIGKLILALQLPEYLSEVLTATRNGNRALHRWEQELAGVSHAEIGGYLLGLWGLPYAIVEAVANHHDPKRVPQQGFDVLAAVHVADFLAHETQHTTVGSRALPRDPFDVTYLEALGVTDRLDAWRRFASGQHHA